MKKLKQSELGFGILELIMITVIIGTLGFAGWRVWQNHSNQSSTNPSQIRWLTYKSNHSSAEFQYPANWKLTKDSSQDDKYTIESATITGTNHFVVQYSLNKTNRTLRLPVLFNCPILSSTTVLSTLNSSLAITYDQTGSIWLNSLGNTPTGYGFNNYPCREGVNYVSLPNDEYVILEGSYGIYKNLSLSPADFLKQHEVKLAVDIFKTFKP